MARAPKTDPRHELGARAEDAAAELYGDRGFSVVERNLRVGRLEIDLVLRKGSLYVLCEVRARRSGGMVHPAMTIRGAKALHMRSAARMWLAARQVRGSVRIDVVAATERADRTFELEVYENVLSG